MIEAENNRAAFIHPIVFFLPKNFKFPNFQFFYFFDFFCSQTAPIGSNRQSTSSLHLVHQDRRWIDANLVRKSQPGRKLHHRAQLVPNVDPIPIRVANHLPHVQVHRRGGPKRPNQLYPGQPLQLIFCGSAAHPGRPRHRFVHKGGERAPKLLRFRACLLRSHQKSYLGQSPKQRI